MRKRNILLSLFVGLLSIASLASCGNKKEKKNTSTESILTGPFVANPNMVSRDVFNSYFGFYEDSLSTLNIKYKYTFSSDILNHDGIVEIADNVIANTFVNYFSDKDSKNYYEILNYDYENDSINYREYYYLEGNLKYIDKYNEEYDSFLGVLFFYRFSYDDFKYNELTKSYECEEIISKGGKYNNISIKFQENKLQSFSLESTFGEDPCEVEFEVLQLGDVEITHNISNVVTNEIFNQYFSGSREMFENLNITLNYECENRSGNILYNQGERLDNYKTSDGNGSLLHTFESMDYSNNLITYSYVIQSGVWNIDEEKTKSIYAYMLEDMHLPHISFNDLEYNENTKCYEASKINLEDKELKDISIKFIDGLLYSYSYTYDNNTYNIIAKIGRTVILK